MGRKLTLNLNGNKITTDDLKQLFDKYNALYFDGKLGKCSFSIMSVNSRCFGMFTARKHNGKVKCRIFIANNTLWTDGTLMEILIHEMIHMYVTTVKRKKFDGILSHGICFRACCKRLKKNYGLNIRIHLNYEYIKKELKPKMWEKVLLWLIDW